MPRNKTLKNLRDRFRELGEHRASYISDAAFLREANQARLELYEKLILAGSDDYIEETKSWDVVANTASYDLPADFLKCLAVDIKLSNTDWVSVPKYIMGDRNLYTESGGRELSMYRIRGNKIVLQPTPSWSEAGGLRMLYVPVPPDLVEDNDTVDGVCGWEDWIVYKCLILFAGKEESDPSLWISLLNQLEKRIDDMQIRDRSNPDRIRDIDREDLYRTWPSFGPPP